VSQALLLALVAGAVIATTLGVVWLPRRALTLILGQLRDRRVDAPNLLGASPLRDL